MLVQARQRINLTSNQAHRIIAAAGIATTITWTPPPAVGGYVQRIEVFSNLFGLDRYQISPIMSLASSKGLLVFTSLITRRHFVARSIRFGG